MKQYFALLFLVVIAACTTEKFDTKMQEDVTYLADDRLEGRQTGTEGEQIAADYIAKRFRKLGLDPKGTEGYFQSFSFVPKTHPHAQVKFTDSVSKNTITGKNVVGFLDNGAENTVIIGAHYDHLGWGSEGSLHRGDSLIHNGADDNASGVAVMLNVADRLQEINTNNNYLFMAFSGEEMGLLGSNYFAKNPTIDIKKVNYMINMDMVGRMKQDSSLAVYGTGTSPLLSQTVHSLGDDFKIIEKESGVGPSDHTSFYLQDLPVLHLFTGQHEDYHKPSDDAELLNYEGMYKIADYVVAIVTELDDNGKLKFTKTKNESEETPRFKVKLGVVPNYLYDGEGMKVDGVNEGGPAANAGIQKKDIVVKMGDLEIVDMMAYMKALSQFERGQTVKVVVQRKKELVETEVTF
ncbi:M20/M25/M40 family metallo-hydrolase [Urechidicola sp. KH5]